MLVGSSEVYKRRTLRSKAGVRGRRFPRLGNSSFNTRARFCQVYAEALRWLVGLKRCNSASKIGINCV